MLTDSQAAKLFQAFASHPSLFGLKPAAYRKAAIDVVATQLKHKSCNLGVARQIRDEIGLDPLLAVLDELKSPAIVALVKKFDKGNAGRSGDSSWVRPHLAALMDRQIEPAPVTKAKKASTRKKPEPKQIVRILFQAKSMGGG